MNIMDWIKLKSSDSSKRIIAIRKLTNMSKITKIARTDPHPKARGVAVDMINNKEILANIAKFDLDKMIRRQATLKLENPEILYRIIKRDKERVVRLAAVEKIKDLVILANLVKYDNDLEIKKAAINRLQQVFIPRNLLIDNEATNRYNEMISILTSALESKGCKIPIDIVRFLGHVGGYQAIEILSKALNNKSAWMRETAIFALSQINDVSTVPVLIKSLDDEREIIRNTAISSLEKLNWIPQTDGEKSLFLIAKNEYEKAAKLGEVSLSPLLKALETEKGTNKMTLVKAIGILANEKSVKPLCNLLRLPSRQNIDLKIAAALALGQIGNSKAIRPLKIAFNNNVNEKIRLAIVESLSLIGGSEIVKILNEISRDNSISEKIKELASEKYKIIQTREFEEAIKENE